MIVGLTGGIGSGKSTVAALFRALGIPVYDSDSQAKRLMNESQELISAIEQLMGPEAYRDGQLNRSYIASKVFSDRDLLDQLNKIVHPAVKNDFKAWAKVQESPYILQEAAIIFENGSQENYDFTILVTAPEALRIERLIARDSQEREAVLARMNMQWKDEKKKELADFEIENLLLEDTEKQVAKLHQELLGIAENKAF